MSDFTVALWRKSTHSQQAGACVEFAVLPGAAAVRDSKRPEGDHLMVPPREWRTFLTAVKDGSFDL